MALRKSNTNGIIQDYYEQTPHPRRCRQSAPGAEEGQENSRHNRKPSSNGDHKEDILSSSKRIIALLKHIETIRYETTDLKPKLYKKSDLPSHHPDYESDDDDPEDPMDITMDTVVTPIATSSSLCDSSLMEPNPTHLMQKISSRSSFPKKGTKMEVSVRETLEEISAHCEDLLPQHSTGGTGAVISMNMNDTTSMKHHHYSTTAATATTTTTMMMDTTEEKIVRTATSSMMTTTTTNLEDNERTTISGNLEITDKSDTTTTPNISPQEQDQDVFHYTKGQGYTRGGGAVSLSSFSKATDTTTTMTTPLPSSGVAPLAVASEGSKRRRSRGQKSSSTSGATNKDAQLADELSREMIQKILTGILCRDVIFASPQKDLHAQIQLQPLVESSVFSDHLEIKLFEFKRAIISVMSTLALDTSKQPLVQPPRNNDRDTEGHHHHHIKGKKSSKSHNPSTPPHPLPSTSTTENREDTEGSHLLKYLVGRILEDPGMEILASVRPCDHELDEKQYKAMLIQKSREYPRAKLLINDQMLKKTVCAITGIPLAGAPSFHVRMKCRPSDLKWFTFTVKPQPPGFTIYLSPEPACLLASLIRLVHLPCIVNDLIRNAIGGDEFREQIIALSKQRDPMSLASMAVVKSPNLIKERIEAFMCSEHYARIHAFCMDVFEHPLLIMSLVSKTSQQPNRPSSSVAQFHR